MVVTVPPLMTVEPLALVVKLAPFKVPVKVVIPVLFKIIAPSAFVAPILPEKVMAPDPVLSVSARAVVSLLLMVEAKAMALLVEVKVLSALNETAPV